MSNDTRRFNSPEYPDQPTQRLANTLLCIRCNTPMERTLTYSAKNAYLPLAVTSENEPSSLWHPKEAVQMRSMTCLNCGYTELYAEDLPKLRMLAQKERG